MFKKIAMVVLMILSWSFAGAFAFTVEPEIKLGNTHVLNRDGQSVFILVRFKVPEIKMNSKDRKPLDLSMVIDRSGSMAGQGKLNYAKQASKKLVDMLKRTDGLSVVEYDDRVTVVWPHTRLENPRLVREIIEGLYPRGSTNLAGGMMKGISQLERAERYNSIKRVLLLSDGLANQGITDPREIARIASQARAKGIAVSTIGLGNDYDENLMQALAESGGGKYYYIEHPNQIAEIYKEELNILFTMVNRNTKLVFNHGEGVKDVEVYGYRSKTGRNRTDIYMNDFHAGEERTVLLKVTFSKGNEGSLNFGSLSLAYDDIAKGGQYRKDFSLKISRTDDEEKVKRNADKKASAEAELITADNEHEKVIKLYEKGNVKEAQKRLKVLKQNLTASNKSYQSPSISKKLESLEMEEDDMNRAVTDRAYRQNYLKQRKHDVYMSKKGKRSGYMISDKTAGYKVKQLQQALKDRNAYSGKVDGNFTDDLKESVKNFQKNNGITVDGIAGPATLRKLGLY